MNLKCLISVIPLALLSAVIVGGQVPVTTHVQILKAEDSRAYDAKLEALMASPEAAVRARAALAAGRIGDKAAVPALVKLLNGDASEKVREMAAFALGEIESTDAADAIRIALGETAKAEMPPGGNASVNERGDAHAIGGRPMADKPMAAVTNVRGRLVEAAGKIAAANAQDPKAKELAEAISFVLASEKNRQTSIETTRLALTAVLRARPAGAEENVRFFLGHTDPGVVSDALNTLARLRAKNANRDARDLLETHTHAVVRANAARLLGAAEDKEASDLLIKAATSDQDSRVRVSAIRSLATLRDAKSADPLLGHAEKLFEQYKASAKPNAVPSEAGEFIEVMTALGRILQFTRNERAINLIREFGRIDKGMTPEVYIARVRINPRRGEGTPPEITDWRQLRTMAQIAGEVASLEMPDDESKAYQAGGIEPMRTLAKAMAEADPATEGKNLLAAPDVLQAFARYKTDDLGEIARLSLLNKDVFFRAAAAGILEDLPPSKENVDALKSAFTKALLTDKKDNDAQLAILNALFKLDKKESVGTLITALSSPDYLVRKSAFDKLSDADLLKDFPGVPTSIEVARKKNSHRVLPYSAVFGTKLGQVLNTDADYRRALSRKNGSISAVFTTAKGSFTIEFLPEDAPLTVDNFVKLARAGYFNGLEVHRVVPNFVMQDGDPLGNGSGGPGWSIRCEVNMVPYERGAVGMALSGKDTGGSQWFVTHSPQPHLDGGYTVFGRVNEKDMAVVDKIVRGDKIISVRVVGR